MKRSVNEENAEETRKVQIVKICDQHLIFSELEAITHIFEELDGNRNPCSQQDRRQSRDHRSVIVNALRKFESAGLSSPVLPV